MIEDDQPTSKASSVLKKIDEQISEYTRMTSKKRWIEIEKHWKEQDKLKKDTLVKIKDMFSKDELLSIGIIT